MKIGFKIVQKELARVSEENMDDDISKCFHGCSSKQQRGNLFICLSSFAFCRKPHEFISIIMVRRQCFFVIRRLWVHCVREREDFLILNEKALDNSFSS